MKALRFAQFGKAEVLRIEEIPDPAPGLGEVLIQIKAAAIKPQ
jgi:NADPH2:quinone reductase